MTRNSILALALVAAPILVGCGSNATDTCEGGPCMTPDAGVTPFTLSTGDNCFTVIAIDPGFSDGCNLQVDQVVTTSLPMNYTAPTATTATATVALGTQGSLGGGDIGNNVAKLVRVNDPTATGTTCSWHQTDNADLTMIANNKFTVSVKEVQSNFGASCGAADVPATGTCTSTWTWTMQRATDTTLVPPACGSTP